MVMSDLRVVTPEAILSYPALFEPKAMNEGQTKKYSAELIFPSGTDLKPLREAAHKAAVAKWGDKIPKKLRSPFRDGSVDREGKPEYEGATFISARTTKKPAVVTGPDRVPVSDPETLYGGCKVRCSVTAFAYDNAGNCGVSFYLNSVWKLSDGTRLGGTGGDDFAGVEVDPESFGGVPF